jgi:hypothetical protein
LSGATGEAKLAREELLSVGHTRARLTPWPVEPMLKPETSNVIKIQIHFQANFEIFSSPQATAAPIPLELPVTITTF